MTNAHDRPDLQDRADLADLAAHYAIAVDTRDFEALRDVFVADAVLDTGRGVRCGIDEILSAMERIRRYQRTSHVLGQQVVDVRPDGAGGITYCTAHHLGGSDDAPTDTVMHIHYHDDFVRTDEGWRIARRRLDIAWTDTQPVH